MQKTMKVALMVGNNQMELVEREVPTPGDDQVLVKIEYVGICGSDSHIFAVDWGKRVTRPHVLGHECAGTVVEVGKNVKNLKIGDKVSLEPGKTCGKCEFCKTGRYNLCPDVIFFGAPNTNREQVDGVFLEYVAHDSDLCFKLPDNVSTLEGALIEPLAVGIHAANQGQAHPGQTAVVIGAGCIGLVSLMALKICGVSKVFVTDIMDNRLAKAKELGADEIINSKSVDTVTRVKELTDGKGCDLVIDTAGSAFANGQAIAYMKKGATLVFVGYSPDDRMDLPFRDCLNKEINFKTVFRYRNIYPMAIESVAAGLCDLKKIVTNIYPLDDIQRAMEESITNKADIVKSVIKIG